MIDMYSLFINDKKLDKFIYLRIFDTNVMELVVAKEIRTYTFVSEINIV